MESYNGYTNHLTWLIHLHLTNDFEFYNDLINAYKVSDIEKDDSIGKAKLVSDYLMNLLEDYFYYDETEHDELNNLIYDIICSAILDVDFIQIANNIFDGIEKIN